VAGQSTSPLLELQSVSRRYDGNDVLTNASWTVTAGQHWVVLGPNGSGKTTMARIASLRLHPTTGRVIVLGTELGKADIRPLLSRVGYAAAALSDQLRPGLAAFEVVMTAKHGALETWWHEYDEDDESRARTRLGEVGMAGLADHTFGTLSSGERQRVLIARALFTDPALVVLDEPTAALDLGGREALVTTLDRLARRDGAAPMVLITHHVDEIPEAFTHALLLRDGVIVHQGPIDEVMTATNLSDTFSMPLELERRRGRWSARAAGPD